MKLIDFSTLTFDVVGTLIDFENGMLRWLRPHLARHGLEQDDEAILTEFAVAENNCQHQVPATPFTDMLPLIYRHMAEKWDIVFEDHDGESFHDSIRRWPPFPDTVEALKELKTYYRLVAVTNADAWALVHMSANMGSPFDEQISCDQVGINKPSARVFDYVLERLAPLGASKTDILHTAQSQYHDIVPAARDTGWPRCGLSDGTIDPVPARRRRLQAW